VNQTLTQAHTKDPAPTVSGSNPHAKEFRP
jgi:hypothetical protein